MTGFYYGYLRDRPDSVLAALRAMALTTARPWCTARRARTAPACCRRSRWRSPASPGRRSSPTTWPPATAWRASWAAARQRHLPRRPRLPPGRRPHARGRDTSSSSCGPRRPLRRAAGVAGVTRLDRGRLRGDALPPARLGRGRLRPSAGGVLQMTPASGPSSAPRRGYPSRTSARTVQVDRRATSSAQVSAALRGDDQALGGRHGGRPPGR